MKTLTLDKVTIEEKIASNYGSSHGHGWDYMLIISPDSSLRIAAVEASRSWNPWNKDDSIARLPAPYGDGSSALTELAEDMLRDLGGLEEARQASEAEDIDLVTFAEKIDEWADYLDNALEWYADEWLSALNGEANDLQIDAAFGTRETGDGDIEHIECPFRFEYK